VNDGSNLQNVVGEIIRRLDEKDTQIEKLQQRLAEQEALNAEQNNRLADQDAIIETLKHRLIELESESASSTKTMVNDVKVMPSSSSASTFKRAENSSVHKSMSINIYELHF